MTDLRMVFVNGWFIGKCPRRPDGTMHLDDTVGGVVPTLNPGDVLRITPLCDEQLSWWGEVQVGSWKLRHESADFNECVVYHCGSQPGIGEGETVTFGPVEIK
jgi:hypothetical protein